jgi:uncharacterized protein (DUF1501 family)
MTYHHHHDLQQLNVQRRSFLKSFAGSSASLALGAGASLSLSSLGLPSEVQAQTNDYRALVCLFLFGGNDGLNTIVPLDDSVTGAGYSDYLAVRKGLALPRTVAGVPGLVELPGSRFGLHPGLAPLVGAWNDQAMALAHNVGPLARSLTQAQYVQWRDQNNATQVPESLFSHSDQQRQWENGASTTISQTGWGGAGAEQNDFRQVVSFAGNTRFGTGLRNNELALPEPGGTFGLSGYYAGNQPDARKAALEALIGQSSSNQLQSTFAGQQRAALDLSRRLESTIKIKPGDTGSNATLNAAFGNLAAPNNSRLAKQLYQVAKMVEPSGRSALGGSRHIFFVSLGGFDTHSNQLNAHATLMADIGRSVAAFYAALKNLGLSDKVTLFTASDFGRTFKPNSSAGTDHAWGNEHFVIGAGVNPKVQVGQYPTLALGGPNDAADPAKSWEFQGRWIPSLGVSQYAGSLLRWLNPQADLLGTLPELGGFGGASGANIGLMKV